MFSLGRGKKKYIIPGTAKFDRRFRSSESTNEMMGLVCVINHSFFVMSRRSYDEMSLAKQVAPVPPKLLFSGQDVLKLVSSSVMGMQPQQQEQILDKVGEYLNEPRKRPKTEVEANTEIIDNLLQRICTFKQIHLVLPSVFSGKFPPSLGLVQEKKLEIVRSILFAHVRANNRTHDFLWLIEQLRQVEQRAAKLAQAEEERQQSRNNTDWYCRSLTNMTYAATTAEQRNHAARLQLALTRVIVPNFALVGASAMAIFFAFPDEAKPHLLLDLTDPVAMHLAIKPFTSCSIRTSIANRKICDAPVNEWNRVHGLISTLVSWQSYSSTIEFSDGPALILQADARYFFNFNRFNNLNDSLRSLLGRPQVVAHESTRHLGIPALSQIIQEYAMTDDEQFLRPFLAHLLQ